MNAYQLRDKIQFYTDVSRNARWFLSDYEQAFNDSARVFLDEVYSPERPDLKKNNGFQFNQPARDKIYTLIATSNPSLTDGTVIVGRYGSFIPTTFNLPTDYYDFVSLAVVISGITDYCRPTEYNKVGPLLDNTFMMPTNKKTYYNEVGTGMLIYRGSTGTVSSAYLTYIKQPTKIVLGSESQWIYAAPGVLTIGLSYIAVEESVQNGVTYPSGTQFTAAVTTELASGVVILASLTTTTNFPDKVQETICKMAAQTLLGITSNFNGSQFVENEISKNN